MMKTSVQMKAEMKRMQKQASDQRDAWMDDPEAKVEFERLLAESTEKLRPLSEAMERSEQITAADLAIVINAKD